MQRVHVTESLAEANALSTHLAKQGIEAEVREEESPDLEPAEPSVPSASFSVWVAGDVDLDRVRKSTAEFLEHRGPGGTQRHWRCRNCREWVREMFTICWKCGGERGDSLLVASDGHPSGSGEPEGHATVQSNDDSSVKSNDEGRSPDRHARPPVDRETAGLWFEVGVVLLVGELWVYYYALASVIWPPVREPEPLATIDQCLTSLFGCVPTAVLVVYLIWRSREPWREHGLCRPRWLLDPLAGVVVCFAKWLFALIVVWFLIELLGLYLGEPPEAPARRPFGVPSGVAEHVVVVASVVAAAWSEEVLYRGYLIPRFERLLRSTWWSILLTSVLFGSVHAGGGVYAIAATFLSGLVYGAAFCLWRRLWPVTLAHALHNLGVGVS